MEKAILLFSDGYSISEIARGTEAECRKIMTNKYNDAADNVEALWLEQSYCEETDAILYMNGEDVFIWKVICF